MIREVLRRESRK